MRVTVRITVEYDIVGIDDRLDPLITASSNIPESLQEFDIISLSIEKVEKE